ncbi:WbqC family protein [Streptomyces lavendulocolor]|uniref:WbqC family protein n=1 Tax=Streptomyces lavendulocolor TaxID=67316 RepID=A0ABV2W1X6_9ACTN
MATVHHWTGLEAKALRLALRLSVRAFAEHLGVGVRTVSKWEKLKEKTEPRPDTQAILDTALARADAAAHLRFETFLSEAERPGMQIAGRRVTPTGPLAWEYESWTDDLDRAVVALSRQDFTFAESLISRWTSRFTPLQLDDRGLYLFARSTALLGDLQRDQGSVVGPLSAQHSYMTARSLFTQLAIPRRIAQLDLSLAVVAEMSGKLEMAARQYEHLAVDDRLSRRDRARSRLWVGTALSKDGQHDYATRVMLAATRDFEDLAEPEDWSVAHQKIALAHRGYQHRTRLAALEDPDRTRWLSIPTHLPRGRQTTIRDALIADPAAARRRSEAMIRQEYRTSPHWPALQTALEPVWAAFDTGRTAAVAETSTRVLLDLIGWPGRVLNASRLPARPERSERLADLTAAAGASTYLCGTGGMTYLDPAPFTTHGIAVAPFLPPTAGIWASARHVTSMWALAHLGPVGLAARLPALTGAPDSLGTAA